MLFSKCNSAYFYFMYFATFLYITVSYTCIYFFHQRNRIYEKRRWPFKATWRERPEICRTAENISGKSKAVLYFEINFCILGELYLTPEF